MTGSVVRSAGIRGSTGGGRAAATTLTICLASLALTLFLLPPPAFAAVYGRTLYPALSALFAALTGWTYLPLGIAVLPILCGILLWRAVVSRRGPRRWWRLARLPLLALLLLSLYLVIWGANYRRPPLLQLLDLTPRQVTQAEIDAFASDLLAWIDAGAMELDRVSAEPDRVVTRAPLSGGEGPPSASRSGLLPASVTPDPATADALAAVARQLEGLALELGWPATVPSRVKLLPAGTLLSSGYAGMLFPFTLEPQLDAGLSAVSRVAIGAHELAHAAGFASEEDADAAALIAGLRSSDPLARYAVALSLLSRSLDSLSAEQRDYVAAQLPVRALRDLGEARARSSRYLNSSLARRVTAVYHRLLRGQGVESGVDAYRRAPVVGALLAAEDVLPRPPLPLPDSGVDDSGSPRLAWARAQASQSLARLGR